MQLADFFTMSQTVQRFRMVKLIFGRLIFLVQHLNFAVLCVDIIFFVSSQADLAKLELSCYKLK